LHSNKIIETCQPEKKAESKGKEIMKEAILLEKKEVNI